MASTCIGDCLNIKSDVDCVRPGTTYAKLYKWPVAEAEFVRSISRGGSQGRRTSPVDSISCRQMYLRSYTFSRKEDNEAVREGDKGGDDAGNTRNERRCCEGREDKDGNEAGDRRRNERRCFGGKETKKVAKNSMRISENMPHMAFVERLIRKCLSCVFSTKVNVKR